MKSQRISKKVREVSPAEIEDDTPYDVECILAAMPIPRSKGLRFWYLVKWHGYPGEDSWEPLEYIDPGCDRLLKSFWHEVGPFDKHSQRTIKPSQEWIDAEIEFFHRKMTEQELAPHGQRMIVYNEATGRTNVYD